MNRGRTSVLTIQTELAAVRSRVPLVPAVRDGYPHV